MSSLSTNLTSSSGSGLDVQATVDQLIYAERAPERIWQKQQDVLNSQASALRSFESRLSTLEDKVNDLKDFTGVLNSRTASSSQAGILTASAGPSVVSGTHSIVVKNLATASSYYTSAIAENFVFSDGATTNLQIGNGAITPLELSGKTLDGASEYINGLSLGVRASVVKDAAGSRLSLVSGSTGLSGTIKLTEDNSNLQWEGSTTGDNAQITVDGIPIESTSNIVDGAISGVTLTLVSENPTTPVMVTVGPDTGRAKQALADFVTAYNSVISALNGQFTVNAETKTAGVLAGDSTIRGLQSTLLAAASYTVPDNGDFQNLRAIGIEMQNDGTLSINDPVLDDVMTAHYADFQRFFQDSTSGFARRVGTDMMTINDSVSGPIAVDLKGVEASSESISDQIDDFEVRIANRETQLLDQYSRLDAMLRQMPLLQSQLTAQLNSLNQK